MQNYDSQLQKFHPDTQCDYFPAKYLHIISAHKSDWFSVSLSS